MGNPDLVIIINNGEKSFQIDGGYYTSRSEAILIAIEKWEKWTEGVENIADKPEELNFELREIKIVEL